jgi:hypothetical protein
MNTHQMLEEVQNEIKRLHKIERLLEDESSTGTGKRKLTKAARKKISDAQKKRWAKVKKEG